MTMSSAGVSAGAARHARTNTNRAVAGLVLSAGIGLSGCASWSPPRTPIADSTRAHDIVPATWSVATSNASVATTETADWWQHFNDAELTALVRQALDANTDVRSAQAALREARALRDVQAAALYPSLDAYVSGQRDRSANGSSGTQSTSSNEVYEAGLDASWEIDVFGANRNALRATEADARASAASLADTQVSIAAEVALAYIEVRGGQTRLGIARENLASQLKTLQITQWRRQAGLTTSLDVEQARATSEQTRAQIPELEISVAKAAHSLAVLVGESPSSMLPKLQQATTAPPVPAEDLALSMPAQTLRQRPDVRAAEHQVSAAKALVSEAEAQRYPKFTLSGSLGLQALTFGALTGGTASTVSALLGSVSMPIFSGGANTAQIRAKDAALEQAWINYEAQILTALQEVEDALAALQGDREKLATLRNAAKASDNAALLASQRYKAGLVDFQVVLETQRTLLDTQDSVAVAATSVSSDYVRLYKALGGGWQPDATQRDPWTP